MSWAGQTGFVVVASRTGSADLRISGAYLMVRASSAVTAAEAKKGGSAAVAADASPADAAAFDMSETKK